MSALPRYWFRAKRYGWGWGLPLAWQGLFVPALFFALLLVGAVAILPRYGQLFFVAYAFALTLCLFIVCLLKGEPPNENRGC